ncbi:hypothetical protein ACLOJK_018989 [Asimina triloba]
MPPKKGPRTISGIEIMGAQSVLPHQEETELPSMPPQWPPEEITDTVLVMSLIEPVETITLDAEGLITRAEFSALTELLRTLQQHLTQPRQQ